jgi:uncharacterized protein YjbI with pentapeptide repeats/beta-lactamase regulating signal transducer with metallopeptidase domain
VSAQLLAQLASAAGAVTAIAVNALWEDALLVVCVWLLLRSWPGLNAATRYLVWSATLIATVVVPVATTLPFLVPSSPATAVSDTAVRAPMPMVTHALTAAPTAESKAAERLSQPAQRLTVKTPAQSAPALRIPERFRMTLPLPLALGVLVVWALLALFAFARLAIGLVRLEGLKRDALPLPVEYRDAMARWTAVNKGSRQVRLCVSDDIDVPVAVGLFDSMILIPRALLERLSEEEVDQISLHELAHLRRADDWSNGLQRLVTALFAWNPGVLFVAQQLDLEREVACDDWVLGLTGSVRPYALCLTKMAETASWPYRPMPAPGVFATRKHISLRIERLLGAGRNAATNLSLGPAAVTLAIVGALAFAMQLVAPSVAASTEMPSGAQSKRLIQYVEILTKRATPSSRAPASGAVAATTQQITVKHDLTTQHEAMRDTTVVSQAHAFPTFKTPTAAKPAAAAKSTPAAAVPHSIEVPATHVHLPGKMIAIPPINIDMPAMSVPVMQLSQLEKTHLKLQILQNLHGQTNSAAAGAAAAAASASVVSAAGATAGSAVHVGVRAITLADAGSVHSCTGCNMAGVDWTGRDMRNVRYVGVDLSRSKLQNTNFSGAVFSGVDFSGSNLRGASFRGAKLIGCDFSKADLSGVDFTGANISGGDFAGAQLPSAQMRAVLNTCTGCDFSHANLSGLDLTNVHANGIDFSHVNLSGANLSGSQFTGVDFSDANLNGAILSNTVLNGCDLGGVDLTHVDLSKAKLIGTDLSSEGKPHP